MRKIVIGIILALVATTAVAIPPGWSKCRHWDGTTILVEGNNCPSGFIKIYY